MVYCQGFLHTWKHFLGTTFSFLEKPGTNNINQLTKYLPQNRLSTVENESYVEVEGVTWEGKFVAAEIETKKGR